MSFDLMLLDPTVAPTVDQIYEILESEEAEEPLSARMRAVIDECGSRWPGEDSADGEFEAPWASWPLAGDGSSSVIEINIRWDQATTMLPALIEIAARHEVVLFDPQANLIHLPARLA